MALVGTLAFLAVAPATVAGVVPWWIAGWRMRPPLFTGARVLGAILAAAGIAAVLESFARFAIRGLGTPAPVLPPRRLVVSGLYRYVRNPMYVAVLSVIAGQALLLGELRVLGYGALVWLAFHRFVVGYEEPRLRKTFGAEYDAFRERVPRWIPRPPRGRA
ncbi:isoprenylcysteine carboxylmethyltransferase family protein [Anaeromyxobacter sp. PSR-1]|uniref:methyltransferase family protein n=2 Tax=unclassified Anaeromyxobacter TaxID=2620896 RepID=UPI0009E61D4F|nr:isoprenylcysteine carboxylmethyltransferase family protein [Anaeromyxobacter sp. PSR-1]